MTRFCDVEVISSDERPRLLTSSYFTRSHTAASRALGAFVKASNAEKQKIGKSEYLDWLQEKANHIELDLLLQMAAAGFTAQTRNIKGKKRLVASIAEQLKDTSVSHREVYRSLEDKEDLIRPSLFLYYNMCSFLRPKELPPIHEPEVVLRVSSRYLPEGAIPAANFEFLPGWIVRLLRDHDEKENPWLEAFTLEELQGHHPKGIKHLYLCALEERTKKQALVRLIAPSSWISHLHPGDTFQSAA